MISMICGKRLDANLPILCFNVIPWATADDVIGFAAVPEFVGWQGYAARHERNVQHLYCEIKRYDLCGHGEGGR